MNKLISILNLDDYFFIVNKRCKHNTTGNLELHTLNSESWVAKGSLNSLKYILMYKYFCFK